MLILGKDTMKDPSLGYARTFVRQVEDCLGLALEQGVQDRQPTPAASTPPAWPTGSARSPPGSGSTRAIAHVEGDDLRGRRRSAGRRPHRQRLPRRLRHRRRARRRRRRRRHRPGHRRLARRRAGRRPLRLDADVVRRAGRRRRRRPRARVRHPGHRRQLLRLPRPRPRRRPPLGFPLAEIAADGSQRDHQARRHRRRGHRRHRHRPAGLRDPVHAATSAPTSPPTSTRSRSTQDGDGPGRRSPASRGAAPPERLKVVRQRARRVPQLDGVRAHRPRHRRQGRRGCAPSSSRTSTARRRSPGPRPPTPPDGRRHRGGRVLPAPVHGDGPAGRPGRQGVHRARGRARARLLPRLHDDRAARPGRRRTASTGRSTSTARAVTHTVVHHDGRREVIADPDGVRRVDPRGRPPPVAVPRAAGPGHPPDAARHVRPRPLRRQGRRRQPRALGGPRRLRRSTPTG